MKGHALQICIHLQAATEQITAIDYWIEKCDTCALQVSVYTCSSFIFYDSQYRQLFIV
jgi:hypothetical protein